MKAGKRVGAVVIAWLAGTLPAVAATEARADHSGILVWAFLGLCALVVLAQVAPAAMLLVELVRGAWNAKKLARQTVRR